MTEDLKITSISIFPVKNPDGKLKAFARVVLNEALSLTNLRIYNGSKGLFVSYPVEPAQKGEEYRQIYYPVTREFRTYIEAEVLHRFNNYSSVA